MSGRMWMRTAVGVGLLLAAVAAAWPAWADMVHIARRDEEASHIWLVPVVAAWLAWVRRDRLRAAGGGYSLVGPAVMAAGGVMGYAGFHHAVQSFWHGGAVLLAAGAVVSVTGWRRVAAVWPAALVLVLLVPVPGTVRQQFAMPLQSATAGATAYIFDLLGVAVQRMGNVLQYRGVDVAVAEACNGMRMVFVLVLVCYTVAFAWPLTAGVRVLLLVLSPVCAVACNVVRLVPTVWLYGVDEQTLGPVFHDVSGWAMVFVAFGLAMGMVGVLRWVGVEVERDSGFGIRDSGWEGSGRRMAMLAPGLAVVVLLVVGGEALGRPRAADAAGHHAAVRELVRGWPYEVDGWRGRDVPMPREAVQLLRPNAMLSRSYHHRATGRRATLALVHTRDARDMAGHYPPNCYPAHGWQQLDAQRRPLSLPGLTLNATAYRFAYDHGATDGATRMHVLSFLILPDGATVPDIGAVRRAAADYTRHFHGAGQVQLITDPALDAAERDAIARDLLQAHRPLLEAMRGEAERVAEASE
ncbi:MAG: exosortase/archaeosortase family protein [Phycisphaeraceae bacterium]